MRELLLRLGYGGSREEAERRIVPTAEGGVEGLIRADRLGLEELYVQAGRWRTPVARSEVQQFVGALHGRRARKGVLITTSTFTREARDDAAGLELRLALIDGPELARLMIAEGLGVRVEAEFPLRRLDAGYFAEEAAG